MLYFRIFILLSISSLLIGQFGAQTDCGSCGSACCSLEFEVDQKSEDLTQIMESSLNKGGPDGEFSFVKLLNLTNERRQSGVRFIIQAEHLGGSFNASIQFAIASNYSLVSSVRGFSISTLATNLCDSGQNYNLMLSFIKSLAVDFKFKQLFGCIKTY